MKSNLLYLFALLLLAVFLGGCASTQQTAGPGQSGSDLPWNKPASWEGTGQLGSALGQ